MAPRVVNAASIATLVSLALIGLLGEHLLPPGWVVLTWCTSIVLVLAGRLMVQRMERVSRRRNPWRLLVVGASHQAVHALEQVSRRTDICVIGFLDDYLPLGTEVRSGKRVLARADGALDVAREHQVDELLIVQGALPDESFDRLMRQAYTTPELPPVRFIPNMTGELVVRLQPAHRGGVPIAIPELRRITGAHAIAKEVFDRVIAVLVLVVASPLFLVAWVWSVAHDRAVFTGTWLVGYRGRRFRRWSLLAWWKDDPAVHRTFDFSEARQHGISVRLLRKLPRFLNVAMGDLSLVGPRPIDDEDLSLYSDWAGVLLSMKPGLVGPWLLHGESRLLPEEELKADLAYVHDYTPLEDIVILWRSARQLGQVLWSGVRHEQ